MILGLLIGCLLCFTNLYFGLQSGWISMYVTESNRDVNSVNTTWACRMSLQSAIIGFLISKLLTIPITPQENVLVQTTAVATGTVRQLFRTTSDMKSSGFLPLDANGSRVCWNYPCIEFARRAERWISCCYLDLGLCTGLVLCYRVFWVSIFFLNTAHRIDYHIASLCHLQSEREWCVD